MSTFGQSEMDKNLNCLSTQDGFTTAMKGIYTGLAGIAGIHGFWEINADKKEDLKEAQERLNQIRQEWSDKISSAKSALEVEQNQAIQARMSLLSETTQLLDTQLSQKVETNRILIFGTIAIVAAITIYILTT